MSKRPRPGARGIRRVSTGCSTCKTRHKKCDETRPACLTCIRAGWKCDFISSVPSRASQQVKVPLPSSLQYPSAVPLLNDEYVHMDYFQTVCTEDFALFFELPEWERMILQGTLAEPSLHHAALAIGALTRSRYHPDISRTPRAIVFSIQQYTMAIQGLHRLFTRSYSSLEYVLIASISFAYIEILLGLDSRLEMHINAGYAVLRNLSMTLGEKAAESMKDGQYSQHSTLAHRHSLLVEAMYRFTAQVNCPLEDRLSFNNQGRIIL